MLDALSWYITIQILGILAFPAVFILFKRLPDRGFTLAKPAAIAFFSYVLWLLGLSHIAPNTQLTIVVVLAVVAVPIIYLFRKNLLEIKNFARQNWPMLLAAEFLFLALSLKYRQSTIRKSLWTSGS